MLLLTSAPHIFVDDTTTPATTTFLHSEACRCADMRYASRHGRQACWVTARRCVGFMNSWRASRRRQRRCWCTAKQARARSSSHAPSTVPARARVDRSWPSTAQRFRPCSLRVSCLGTRAAASPMRSRHGRGCLLQMILRRRGIASVIALSVAQARRRLAEAPQVSAVVTDLLLDDGHRADRARRGAITRGCCCVAQAR